MCGVGIADRETPCSHESTFACKLWLDWGILPIIIPGAMTLLREQVYHKNANQENKMVCASFALNSVK